MQNEKPLMYIFNEPWCALVRPASQLVYTTEIIWHVVDTVNWQYTPNRLIFASLQTCGWLEDARHLPVRHVSRQAKVCGSVTGAELVSGSRQTLQKTTQNYLS